MAEYAFLLGFIYNTVNKSLFTDKIYSNKLAANIDVGLQNRIKIGIKIISVYIFFINSI